MIPKGVISGQVRACAGVQFDAPQLTVPPQLLGQGNLSKRLQVCICRVNQVPQAGGISVFHA